MWPIVLGVAAGALFLATSHVSIERLFERKPSAPGPQPKQEIKLLAPPSSVSFGIRQAVFFEPLWRRIVQKVK